MVGYFEMQNIVIIGTGVMGTGIAQSAIENGLNVTLVGRSIDKCELSRANIVKGLQRTSKKRYPDDNQVDFLAIGRNAQAGFISSATSRLKLTTNLFDGCKDAQLIIEAVIEKLEVKQNLFKVIENVAPENCILATNTSSFLLEEISAGMFRRRDFGGLHFFNPVQAIKLVANSPDTSKETIEKLVAFCEKGLGKIPINTKSQPGFIVNRLLIPYLLDAVKMVERGDANPSDIDNALRFGAAHPMGPFQLIDLIGLDTLQFIVDGFHRRYPDDPRFAPSNMLNRLVNENKLGKKTGEGFYAYDK